MERGTDSGEPTRSELYVAFEIALPGENDCPLGRADDDVGEIRQHLVGDECHTDMRVYTEDCDCPPNQKCTEVVHSSNAIEGPCPCVVFGEFGCVPEIVAVTDGQAHVETYLPDRDRLDDLVAELQRVAEGVYLRQLKRVEPEEAGDHGKIATLEIHEVTEKQREAVAKAVAAGYYSTPREVSFDELAAELDISKSALSQRLNAAESKLATAAFTRASADD